MRVRVLGRYGLVVGDEGAPGFKNIPGLGQVRRFHYPQAPVAVQWTVTRPVPQEDLRPRLVMWEEVNWGKLILGAIVTGVFTAGSAWATNKLLTKVEEIK